MRATSVAVLAVGVAVGILVSYVAMQVSSPTASTIATRTVTTSIVMTSPVTMTITSVTTSPVTTTRRITSLLTTTEERSVTATETLVLTSTETTTEVTLPFRWIAKVTIYNYSSLDPGRTGVWRIDDGTMGVRLLMWTDAPYEHPDRWAVLRIVGPGVNVTLPDEDLKQLGFDITKADVVARLETSISDVSPIVGEKYHLEILFQREDGSTDLALTVITNEPLFGGLRYPAEWMNFIMTDGDPGNYAASNWGGPDP